MNLDSLNPLPKSAYPEQMLHVDRGIHGSGFYPGARGFPNEISPYGGVMLLGRDWGTKNDYDRFSGWPARDESGLTWRNTRDVYLAGLSNFPVWCTNYLMGVRKDGSAEGNIAERIDLLAWIKYESACWGFLQQQVLFQRPKVIVIFGPYNRDDLQRSNRLGVLSDAFEPKSFQYKEVEHSSLVTLADHPRSLTNPICRARALQKVEAIVRQTSAVCQP
jgi:hypothetical protein